MGRNGRAVLVTGTSRARGIGGAIAQRLADDGWDVGLTWWLPGGVGTAWAGEPDEPRRLIESLRWAGARVAWHEADLTEPGAPGRVFDAIEEALGPVSALVLDQRVAGSVRATRVLVRELARRLPSGMPGRVISLSSDGVAGGVARGAAKELGALGITVNAVDPGRLADTAALVSLLCSDAGGWITGQVLHSGGGFALS